MTTSLLVVVVGAGIGGLAAAISLAAAGHPVLVLEKDHRIGGKIRQEVVDGRPIDAGPTVLTMRWVFDELFERAGETFDDHVRLQRASRIARHFWTDGSRLDLYADEEQNAEAIGAFAGPSEARGYLRFAAHTRRVFNTVEDVFLRSDRPTVGSTLSAIARVGPAALWRVQGHRTMINALGDYFADPRLVQLFARYATYAGSSPWMAPATLNVIAHVEQQGVWLADGGMRAVADACERLAIHLGVEIRCGVRIEEIVVRHGRACGVRTESGEIVEASAVVFNGDPAAIAAGMAGSSVQPAAVQPKHRSLSAVTTCSVAEADGCELDYHSVFFSDDYEREFIQLFHEEVVPDQPTVYVCAQDRAGFGPRPNGAERLFFLINAPAHGSHTPPTETSACQTAMLDTLRRCGWNLRLPASSRTTLPEDFANRFPATGGALYGAASHGMMSPLARAAAISKVPGLYFAGGGAHPGAGVPMAATSGMLASRAILRSFASTRSFQPTATVGGMSTS